MKHVDIFWTSGLDSTCRVVELASSAGFEIKPWYILDSGRASSPIEIDRIAKMSDLIRNNPATKSELLDTTVVPLEEIKVSPDDAALYEDWRSHNGLGTQYLWLSTFLREREMFAELAAEAPHDRVAQAFLSECAPVCEGEGVAAVLKADMSKCSAEGGRFLGKMLLPKRIWDLYKKDEIHEMQTLGYDDVFKLTWFCHRPILGMPCGHCAPCKTAIRDGLGWRVPIVSRGIYPLVRPFQKLFK